MNAQIRRIFIVILGLFALLGLATSNIQVIQAPTLNADSRNSRTILHSASLDRGPIIVAGTAVASSQKVEDSKRYQRHYSDGPLYAPVTGYFSSAFTTASGLEAVAENVLDGESQALLGQRLRNLFAGESRKGGGLVLTIDPTLQRLAAEQLGNRKGAVVVLDAQTGAILALYSSPSYDPNALAVFDSDAAEAAHQALIEDPRSPLTNRAIAGNRYAPGSTAKIFTTIALLENGSYTPESTILSPVTVNLPGTSTQVSNIESSECGDGNPTLQEAFARSCNTTFVNASEKITAKELAAVASRFGFGRDLDIPLEVTPSYFPDEMDSAQTALAAIGQYTVQATPLQMAMVAQGIAAKGVVMRPFLVSDIVDADLQVHSSTTPKEYSNPITPEIADQLTSMMRDVVHQPYGTANALDIPGRTIAAKTGTAEIGDGSGFANAWALGFAPAEDPQLAFAVLVEGDDSEPVPHGGTSAAPIARVLLEAGLK